MRRARREHHSDHRSRRAHAPSSRIRTIGALLALVLAAGLGVALDLGRPVEADAATIYGRVTNSGGRCLENLNNATTVNNRIRIWTCGTAPAQQWSRQPDTTLRTPAGRCIEPYLSRTADNTPVVLVVCSGSTSQQWTVTNGTLVNKRTGKCLQYSGSNVNGSSAATATCRNTAAQRWTVPAVSTPTPPPTTTTTPRPTTTTTTPRPTTTTTTPRPTTTTTTPRPTTTTPPTTTTTTPPPTTTTTTVDPTTTTTTVDPTATSTDPVINPSATTTTVDPTTTTTPPWTPAPFDPVGRTVWAADLTQPDVVRAGFKDNSWNRQLGDGIWNNPALPWPIAPVAAPGDRGGRAVPFTLPNDAIRLEVEPNHRLFLEGDDYYFGFAFYLQEGFPLDTTNWQVIEQLHAAPGTGSPPVGFQVSQGGLLIDGGAGKPGATPAWRFAYQQRLVDLVPGRWYNVVYRVTFSESAEKSVVDVWVDGQNVLAGFHPPGGTVYPPLVAGDRAGTYRKQGLYHSRTIPGGTIFMAGQKLGTGYAAADPSR